MIDGGLNVETGTLTFNQDENFTLSGAITGSGSVTKTGGGTLTLTGTSTYSGGTTINNGVVEVNGGSISHTGMEMRVGDVTGDDGTLEVVNGGRVSSEGDSYIGRASGSEGTATVVGVDSEWANAVGTLYVGGDGTGTLTVADGGTVSTQGETLVIADDTDSTGTLNIGARAGSAATAAGIIDAPLVRFGGGDGTIVFNHTDTNYTFDADISGQGTVEVHSGMTALTGTSMQLRTEIKGGTLAVRSGGSVGNGLARMHIGTESGQTGTLEIGTDGYVRSYHAYIGNDGTGIARVSGGNAVWDVDTVLLLGANENSGTLTIENGGVVNVHDVLTVGYAEDASGSITVDGGGSALNAAQMHVGSNGAGELTLSNGGAVTVNSGEGFLILDNSYTGSTGTLNFGAYDLAAPTKAGRLDAAAILFDHSLADGAVNFNQTDDLTLSVPIRGNVLMSVNQRGSGTTTLTGIQPYGGDTTVSGGRLVVDGVLQNSSVAVLTGGTLGGSGTVGTTTVADGGMVAPGNSIGTLTVGGNFTLNAGATLAVEIDNAGNADLLEVTDAASLANGALIHVTPETAGEDGSSYADGQRYTILTAGTGLTVDGEQDITDGFAYLDFTGDFDANAYHLVANLSLAAGGTFCLEGMSVNQCTTGEAVFGQGEGDAVYSAVLGLGHAQAAPGLDSLSGEGFASAQGQFSGSGIATGMSVLHRVDQAFAALGSAQPMGYAPSASGHDGAQGNAWISPFGGFGHLEGDGNAAALDTASGGVLLGSDMFHGDWLVGGFTGAGRTNVSIPGRDTTISSTDLSVGAYGGWSGDAFGLALGGAYTRHLVSSTREVAALGETLEAEYGANTLSVFGEINTTLEHGATDFVPYARLGLAHTMTEGFTETGSNAALTVDPDNHTRAVTELGVRAEHKVALDTTLVTLSGGIGWRHGFGDAPTSTNAFSGGDPFTVTGNASASDALILDAGLDLDLSETANLALNYEGQFSGVGHTHQLGVKLGVSF